MQDDLMRAQRYRALADEMESLARSEPDAARRSELEGLAQQYRKLADKLIKDHQQARFCARRLGTKPSAPVSWDAGG